MRSLPFAVVLAASAALTPAAACAAPPGSPWGADYFPDLPLVTQEGRTERFYSDLVKDKYVVINFIFTRCQAACPLETANLARVQRQLVSRMGRDIFFYSITLDAEHDTPAVLKEYAQRFHAGPGWLFLTGRRADIDLIRAKLGDRTKWQNHAVGLSLGNDLKGQWTSLSAVDDPGFLATQIDEWMRADPRAHAPVKSYADAPRVHSERSADLFRTHCAACHTTGGGDGVGPDLAGVTQRRGRRWLTRWLADPDQLLSEKDPEAIELWAGHQRVSMPKFSLTSTEIAGLIDYLDTHSSASGPSPAHTRSIDTR